MLGDHLRRRLLAEGHLLRLVFQRDPFLLARDLVHVARVAVVGNQREGHEAQPDQQPQHQPARHGAALAAADRRSL